MNDYYRSHECEDCLVRRQASEVSLMFEEKASELSTIREAGNSLRYIRNFPLVCRNLLDVVLTNTRAQRCSLMLLDRQKNMLYPIASNGSANNGHETGDQDALFIRNPSGGCHADEAAPRRAILERKAILVQEDASPSISRPSGPGAGPTAGSLLAVPLIVEDEPLGVLTLSHAEKNMFGKRDLRLFGILSNFLALVIHASLEHQRLRNSEEKYRALSENASDGIAIVQEGLHVYANPKYRKLTGYSFEQLETLPFGALVARTARPNQEGIPCRPTERLVQAEPFETVLIAREGRRISVEIHATAIRFDGREADLVSIRDLTDRKLLEEQIVQARKMEAVGTLAGGIAHDFNNLLQAILGYGELLTHESTHSDESLWKLRQITTAAKRGAALTRQLLTFSRKIEPQPQPMDLNGLAGQMKHLLERILPGGIDIVYDLQEKLRIVNADTMQMEQVLFNLAVNGRDAMPEGGRLTIRTRNVNLTEEDRRAMPKLNPGPYVLLRVEDTGCGMDAEILRHIFEPFFTTKDVGRGTGLGMAMVYGIVKEHGGEIVCASSPGSGTAFTIHLPAIDVEETG